MAKPLEVRANVSFRNFRAMRVYEVDLEDDTIMSLIGVGYLTPTAEGVNDVRDDRLESTSGLDVRGDSGGAGVRGVRVVGSSESGVEDGANPSLSDDNTRGSKAGGSRRGTAAQRKGTAGIQDPG